MLMTSGVGPKRGDTVTEEPVCQTCDKSFEEHYLDQADEVGDWNWHIKGGPYLPTHRIIYKGQVV